MLKYLRDDGGASAAEYALILAIVGIGVAVAMTTLSTSIGGAVTKAGNCISSPSSTTC